MRNRYLAFAVAALAFAAGDAAACPGYTIAINQVSGTSYSPVDTVDAPLVVQLVANGAPLPTSCETLPVRIEGAPGDPRPLQFKGGGGSDLVADLMQSTDASIAFSALTLSPDARARLVRGQPVNVQIGRFQAGQFLRAGVYTALLRATAGATEVSEAMSVAVEPAFLLQLSSLDGVEEILLNGDPQTGTSGSTVFFYKTNTNLRVSASSLNGGALVHQRGVSVGRIPYKATLDGVTLSLSNGSASVDFGFVQTNLQSRTIMVEVPPAGPLAAGRYEDVITFSFAAY
ncbi:hypothetical protein [Sphingomonas sp.]|jgi:hypothetical protein|uniref:hypothetical protein n=1 Tax=Sphingomonas sp. TaxID=28214 RepID=UPI002E0FCB28|nr:hypothetical protein [Sphingomonas sp.]